MAVLGPQLNINHIKLVSDGGKELDIRHLIDSISIYEDLFSPTMSGTIKMNEAYNLPEVFPIIGEETLDISITTYHSMVTKKTLFEKKFRVIGVEQWEVDKERTKAQYLIHFASEPAINNARTVLRCAYGTEKSKKLGSDIVTSIATNILGISQNDLNVEKTMFSHHLVCSGWRPLQAINWIAMNNITNSSEVSDKDSTFVFFENGDGFNFVSWATLIEDKFIKGDKIIDTLYYGTLPQDSTIKIPENLVTRFQIKQLTDELSSSMNGMFGNTTTYVDFTKKKVTIKDLTVDSVFDEMSKIEQKNELFTNKRKISATESFRLASSTDYFENYLKNGSKWLQKQAFRVGMFDNFVIEAHVYGNTSHRVGSTIMFDVPSTRAKTGDASKADKQKYDQLSGKYLITAIRHIITPMGLNQIMELRKISQQTKVY